MDSTSASAIRPLMERRSGPLRRRVTGRETVSHVGGGGGGGALAQRLLQGLGEVSVVLVARRENPALGHLPREIPEQLREPLLGDLPGGRGVKVDLAGTHRQRVPGRS